MYTTLSSRFGSKPYPRAWKRCVHQLRQHDCQLHKITTLKNETRRLWRKAQRESERSKVIIQCAANFLSLHRQHSHPKKLSTSHKSTSRAQTTTSSDVKKQCNMNFWHFSKVLLKEGSLGKDVSSSFSQEELEVFFKSTVSSNPTCFSKPS